MKRLLPIFCLLFACNSTPGNQAEGTADTAVLNTAATRTAPDFNTALQFINDYTAYSNNPVGNDAYDTDWIQKSKLVTPRFKAAHKAMIDAAWKEEPELGLGFNPVFDGQDFPSEGFEIKNRDSATGYLTVAGKKWKDFEVTLKLTNEAGAWLIDGAGVVNIPKEKQAKR